MGMEVAANLLLLDEGGRLLAERLLAELTEARELAEALGDAELRVDAMFWRATMLLSLAELGMDGPLDDRPRRQPREASCSVERAIKTRACSRTAGTSRRRSRKTQAHTSATMMLVG